MTIECKRFTVSGIVQGVFFRDSTRNKANELSLTGWVRNTDDGKVELVACGDAQHLQQLEEWLWQGPVTAKVDEVVSETCSVEEFEGFVIR